LIDPTAVNMLYIEAISDLDGGRVTISDEMKTKISTLKKNGKKKEVFHNTFPIQMCMSRNGFLTHL
jgi:hypothetical protein